MLSVLKLSFIMLSVLKLSVLKLSFIMLSVILLSVIMLSAILLSVILPSVIMLSVIMLSVIMLSAILLSVILLTVVAPSHPLHTQMNTVGLFVIVCCQFFQSLVSSLLQSPFCFFWRHLKKSNGSSSIKLLFMTGTGKRASLQNWGRIHDTLFSS